MANNTMIGSSFFIRPIIAGDMASLQNVYRQCEDFLALGPDPRASVEMIEKDRQISRGAGGIFCGIFADDQTMIGVVDFIPGNFEGNPNHAFIELLMIATPARRTGIGRKVVNLVEEEISRDPHITHILSAVQVNNPIAINFWKKAGYQITGEPTLEANGTTVYILSKRIGR